MNRTQTIRNWKIDRWGLLRGLAILVSSLLAITVIHYVLLTLFRG
jgi:hypothetical protein